MKTLRIFILALVIPACMMACHGSKTSSNADSTAMKKDSSSADTLKPDPKAGAMGDSSFAAQAAVGGIAEVALGKMAIAKSGDKKIKDFGRMMVDEHGKANADLNSVAKTKNWNLPTTMDAEHKAKSDSLSKLNGKDFDKAYVAAMIDAHQKTLALMQNEARNGKDPDLKNFADRTAPVVQMHLTAIQKIHDSMK